MGKIILLFSLADISPKTWLIIIGAILLPFLIRFVTKYLVYYRKVYIDGTITNVELSESYMPVEQTQGSFAPYDPRKVAGYGVDVANEDGHVYSVELNKDTYDEVKQKYDNGMTYIMLECRILRFLWLESIMAKNIMRQAATI